MADVQRPGAQRWVPERPGSGRQGIQRLSDAAERCRGCELWQDATQVVFSRGPANARIMLVGEQPGDREDLEGEPFVGPAGARVLLTAHPSSALRLRGREEREEAIGQLVSDLAVATSLLD